MADPKLAIDGGVPTLIEVEYPWPPQNEAIRQALLTAYESGDWGRYHGSNCESLSAQLREYHGVEHSQLVCSGTFGVELALRALGVEPEHEVVIAGYDFPGNFRAIEAVGAIPVLVDIDRRTWCMDARFVEEAISAKTCAILVSHLHGGLADMPHLREIADRHGIQIVEDACQAHGANVYGKPAGTWGDVGVLSFGGSKLLTSGRGGALLTNDSHVNQRATVFRERGNDAYALSELQAAVLLPQLDMLDELNDRRAESVKILTETAIDGIVPPSLLVSRCLHAENAAARAGYFKLGWLLSEHATRQREWFVAAMKAEGVTLNTAFRGFTRRSARRCRRIGDLKKSQAAASNTLLLHHPILLQPAATIIQVTAALKKVAEVWHRTSIQGSQQVSET